ncbi:MAG: dephospho-CoA kinase [Lautropia sp.]|nr:dephospho-CoA kinase [Lautropia sp.]
MSADTSPPSAAVSRPPLLIGLTGGIGSGKSLVADLFVARGAGLIDTDQIAHQLTAPGGRAIDAIRETFGEAMISADGRMDRAAMRERVFTEPATRHRLEAILHPMIHDEAMQQLATTARARAPYVLIAVPLLVESGHWREHVDRILVVDCPEALQLERVGHRSKLSPEQVRAIMAAQASRADRLAAADDVIDNSGDIERTEAQVRHLHARYVGLSQGLTPH